MIDTWVSQVEWAQFSNHFKKDTHFKRYIFNTKNSWESKTYLIIFLEKLGSFKLQYTVTAF